MPVFNIFELLQSLVSIEDEIEMQLIGIIFGHFVIHIMLLTDVCVVIKFTFMIILITSLVVQSLFISPLILGVRTFWELSGTIFHGYHLAKVNEGIAKTFPMGR